MKSKRQRKQYSEHDYNNNQFQNDICDKTGSSELKLKVQTLEKWQNNQNELQLPCDHGFDPKDLTSSFIKPETTFKCAKSNEEILDTTINSNNDSFGVANSPGMDRYDYDDDENDLNTAGFTDPLDLGQSAPVSLLYPTTGDTFPFVGNNLIEQEYELQQYNVTFAKFAKKMDVKKLKTAMWSCITTPTLPNTPLTSNHEMQMPSNLNFGELYQLLPKKITPVMATNLSAPIAFVTLLHLCNERNLKLIGREDLEDFYIEKEVQI